MTAMSLVPTAVVVASEDTVAGARASVRSAAANAACRCVVVDLDGCYEPVGDEVVIGLGSLVESQGLESEAVAAAATLEPEDFTFYAGVLGAAHASVMGAHAVAVMSAGVLVVDDVLQALSPGSGESLVVAPAADPRDVRRRAAAASPELRMDPRAQRLDVVASPAPTISSRAVYVIRTAERIATLRGLASDWRVARTALDVLAGSSAARVAPAGVILGPWDGVAHVVRDRDGRLRADGVPVAALDLTRLDPHRPWILDVSAPTSPGMLLSDHPVVAEVVRAEAEIRSRDVRFEVGGGTAASGDPIHWDAVLRAEARRAEHVGAAVPDVLGLGDGPSPDVWALALVPEGHPLPLTRYLSAVHGARPDLQQAFPRVPGADVPKLARWARTSGLHEPEYDPELLSRSAQLSADACTTSLAEAGGPHPPGVNLVGYLSGELGLGESARLVDNALQAAGVPTSTLDVSRDTESRRTARYRRSELVLRDTTLVHVNGAETARLLPQLRPLLKGTRVIGMWYWELEDFPEAHRAGFRHVDEVWAATDFMRDAIARHAGDVPVRTVTPPLPQAGDGPGVLPARFGIPTDRPWFLFTFDYLSLAIRKNPYGLVEAFTRAFGDVPAAERPTLVIKTINADRHPADAERLRLQAADRTDIILVEDYLAHDERHVLVSHCTAYVSLHRAEGLGLTVAEAMAWGRPVITTAYGGVMQFCDERNAYLVDWSRGSVPETVDPYTKGLPWAEPDLDHAAACMRAVVRDPGRAAVIAAQAAEDIRTRHSHEAAGEHMRQVLQEGREAWRKRVDGVDGADPSAPSVVRGVRQLAAAGRLRIRRTAAKARRR